jgi:hypothetical protein
VGNSFPKRCAAGELAAVSLGPQIVKDLPRPLGCNVAPRQLGKRRSNKAPRVIIRKPFKQSHGDCQGRHGVGIGTRASAEIEFHLCFAFALNVVKQLWRDPRSLEPPK